MLHTDPADMPVAKLPSRKSNPQATKATKNPAPVLFYTKNQTLTKLYHKCNLVAESEASVLLTGESGSGKEVLARMIHDASWRCDQPFVAINCGAIPKEIIENELFGHEKGAFTGATNLKQGSFEQANGGTLFLDEIGEMSPETQVKLLRAVETGSFRRLGGASDVHVDLRIISSTNKNMSKALKDGSFREDLYYRLGVVEFEIPPLRYRKDDIPDLASLFLNHFCEKYAKSDLQLSDDVIEKLIGYEWPGNVRELRNIMEYVTVTTTGDFVELSNLPERIASTDEEKSDYGYSAESENVISFPLGVSMKDVEQKLIDHTLRFVKNNKSEAARILGVSRKTLHNKLTGIE